MELVVSPTGQVVTLYNEQFDLSPLGQPRIERASHVEPDEQGRWFAQIIDGPILGPYAQRSIAIAAEVAWLTEHRLHS